MALYISSLDTSSSLDACGNFVGVLGGPTSVDVSLNKTISKANIKNIFKFTTDGSLNTLTDGSANVYASTTYALFDASYAVANVAVSGDLVDASLNVSPYGRSSEVFMQALSKSMFGSSLAVDMITNEDLVVASYVRAINSCKNAVNTKFTSGSADAYGAAQTIYDHLVSDTPARFSLKYGAASSSANASYDCSANQVGATPALVTVDVSGGIVTNIVVNTTGSDYTDASGVTFTDPSGVVATIATINSVQSAMLNGSLTSATSIPFETGDAMQLRFTISSNAGQLGADDSSVVASIQVGVNVIVA